MAALWASLAILFYPVSAQAFLKLLDLFFGKNTYLFAILEVPESVALISSCLVLLLAPNLIFFYVNQNSNFVGHTLGADNVATGHLGNSFFIAIRILGLHLSAYFRYISDMSFYLTN